MLMMQKMDKIRTIDHDNQIYRSHDSLESNENLGLFMVGKNEED